MLHSNKLSKSKAFGIYVSRSAASLWGADARSRSPSAGGATHVHAPYPALFGLVFAIALTTSSLALAGNDGVITVKSDFSIGETIVRLKKDIADKGIKFF